MFKYLPILLIFWYQTQGRAFDERADTQIDPLKSLTSNNQNCSEAEDLNKTHVVMNGHNNYHVGQQIFYIYNEQLLKKLHNEQPLKQLYNEQPLKELSNNTKILDGYVVTPGISAHKLHSRKLTWNKARQACIQEGGHLAIINSDSEEKILLRMLEEKNINYAFIGLHDYFEEGDWVSVKGEALENTGYTKWTTAFGTTEPNNHGGNQHCATLVVYGGMDDFQCYGEFSFFCEIPL